jgi:cytochrome b
VKSTTIPIIRKKKITKQVKSIPMVRVGWGITEHAQNQAKEFPLSRSRISVVKAMEVQTIANTLQISIKRKEKIGKQVKSIPMVRMGWGITEHAQNQAKEFPLSRSRISVVKTMRVQTTANTLQISIKRNFLPSHATSHLITLAEAQSLPQDRLFWDGCAR